MTHRYSQLVALEQRVADMEKRLKTIEERSAPPPQTTTVLTSIFPTTKRTVVLRKCSFGCGKKCQKKIQKNE